MELKDANVDDAGPRAPVKVTKENTIIVDGAGESSAIKDSDSPDKQPDRRHDHRLRPRKLQERLAKLSGGVAVIKVGAATETEMKEKKLPHRGRPERDPRGR